MTPLTLPILEALDYLYARNLTIDRLWAEHPSDGPPETHITTKRRPDVTEPAVPPPPNRTE